ncbi:nucleoside diphosphate kinase 6-like [Tubulanus polymorphus]|uniref:nucleoside diphosphate kinase 6-like n=1 Tax=Tubulanus polymorphus TaxID=672921 RepID=UPI003DA262D3
MPINSQVTRNVLQLTLALLKPDLVAQPHLIQGIHDRILQNNFLFVRSKVLKLSQERAAEFYKEHTGKFFHNRLVLYMSSGPLYAHILAREDAIAEWRKLMGPTKVFRTLYEQPNTLRGLYGLTDTRNGTHGSDSAESAKKEINFFFPEFDYQMWFNDEELILRTGNVSYDAEKKQHYPSHVS